MSNYSDSKFNANDANTSWHKTFNLIPEKSLVLDIGCSNGTFGKRLIEEKNCVVDGIEINKEDLKAAQKKLRHVYDINIETDPLAIKDKYDVVFMGDVIEHLATPIETLKKVRELLKPDGMLVFSIPNITHMSVRLMLLKGEISYGRTGLLDETHLHFYSAKEVHRVLNGAGLAVTTFDYTVNDIPKAVLQKELDDVGLKVTEGFMKIARSLDAGAYQFIGCAKKSPPIRQQLPKVSPLNLIDAYLKELQKNYDTHTTAIIADRDRILAENQLLHKQLDELRHTFLHSGKQYIKKRFLQNGQHEE